MPEQLTIAERIELLQNAVREWEWMSCYSYHARVKKRQSGDRTAWSDAAEIIRDYENSPNVVRGIDPVTAEVWKTDPAIDLDRARPVEDTLNQHGLSVASWLSQQQIEDREALCLFLSYRTPDLAERAHRVLTIARTHAQARQEKKQHTTAAEGETGTPLSLRRVGEVWHLRYHDEQANFPVNGNQFIGWLAKLLAKPTQRLTVADLRGDPEGKLEADARLSGCRAQDQTSLMNIKKAIEDIEAIADDNGWTEALEERRDRLLKALSKHVVAKRLKSSAENGYTNIMTQKNNFIRDKLTLYMPQLAAHLRSCIDPDASSYTFAYRPPESTPHWQIENPSA